MVEAHCLVTGGAGYIGSHVAQLLRERGRSVVILDDLSRGVREAALDAPLIVGDVGDEALVSQIIDRYHVDAVLHFAALTVVPDSVRDPLRYYDNNTSKAMRLIKCCVEGGVRRFIFSSTAAVYGIPAEATAHEDLVPSPINPYGASKLMTENILRDVTRSSNLAHVILRYFNVAGCDPQGRIGQNTPQATLLVKVACEHAVGLRDSLKIFGTDFPTADGTGVRDYIHVSDLANAHVLALEHLESGGESMTLNCGYGRGYSVREVIDAVERAVGHPLNVIEAQRRAGDPPSLVARAERIRQVLGWKPALDDLDQIVASTLAWERRRLASEPLVT